MLIPILNSYRDKIKVIRSVPDAELSKEKMDNLEQKGCVEQSIIALGVMFVSKGTTTIAK